MSVRSALSFLFVVIFVNTASARQSNNGPMNGLMQTLNSFSSASFANGVSTSSGDLGDFAENGFNSNLNFSKSVCEMCEMDFTLGYTNFLLKDDFIPDSSSDYNFDMIGLKAGPRFSFGRGTFSMDLYGKAGFNFINTPELEETFRNTDEFTTRMRNKSVRALSVNIGANVNVQVCEGFGVFLNAEYTKFFNSDVVYQTRSVVTAVNPVGVLDPDLLEQIPVETQTMDLSYTNFNIGFKIDLGGGKKGGTRAQDYNSSRSNNSSAILLDYQDGDDLILRKRPGRSVANDPSTGNQSGGNRAQDYNSSRSNNGSAGVMLELDDGEDIVLRKKPGRTRAQDYNSSRSNTTMVIFSELGDGEDLVLRKRPGRALDESSGGSDTDQTGGTRAQDYNSSRSNNGSVIVDWEGDDLVLRKRPGRMQEVTGDTGSGEGGGNRAQDYNSSRSNNGSAGIVWVGDNDIELRKKPGVINEERTGDEDQGGTRAQDYNSSRSNNSGIAWQNGEDIILRKRPGRMMDDGSGTSGRGGISNATDYNSSRSNTTSSISLDFTDGEDIILRKRPGRVMDDGSGENDPMGGTRAQDYNSSRSNTTMAIFVDLELGTMEIRIFERDGVNRD